MKLKNEKSKKKKEEAKESETSKLRVYNPPKGASQDWSWKSKKYSVIADWVLIRKKEKIIADIFYTYYSLKKEKNKNSRSLTFVFNGGPGASSAYLHVGALGPKSVQFGAKGESLPPPFFLKENKDSWLEFTDLVFVDPVGTGFSRSLEEVDFTPPEENVKEGLGKEANSQEFYKMNRDLESICEFVQQFLSKHHRWSSMIFIAGESYGGFRVAMLSRKLQEDYGVGLKGVILISPCLELNTLDASSDYDILPWVGAFPSMAAAAAYHKKSRFFSKSEKGLKLGSNLRSFLKPAEIFSLTELTSLLTQGEMMDSKKRESITKKVVQFLGIPLEKVIHNHGRFHFFQFCRLLLAEERKWCGMYDASLTTWDPFPDRESYEGPDPNLSGLEHVFTHGIHSLLRDQLRLDCERQYHLLNEDVNRSWQRDKQSHFFDLQVGSVDDLRYAMSMNPSMNVFICHGIFDLVTPYFSSARVIELMKLPVELKKKISFQVFHGGHMFYTWKYSRQAFTSDMQKFYKT